MSTLTFAVKQAQTLLWIAAAVLLAACAGPWRSAPETLGDQQWQIRPPKGWMYLAMPDADMFSKNGPYLEYILVQSRPLTQAFRSTRQKLSGDMLPHEAAQVIIDSMRFDPQVRQFELLGNRPATVGGRPGFKVTYRYRDAHDVTLKAMYIGVILYDRLITLRYTATQRHYFDAQESTFNTVVDSLRFIPAAPSS